MTQRKAKPKAAQARSPGTKSARTTKSGEKTRRAAGDAPVSVGKKSAEPSASPASLLIDQRIRELEGWRGETLARMRALILEADPEIVEEWKWSGPVWSCGGILCTGESYKKAVKLTFARGASLPDPLRLFNSSLEGNTRRAIDIHEGETVEARAFQTLVRAAVAQNGVPTRKTQPLPRSWAKPVKLLSGGNPQIAKADGNAPVQAYIAAMPDWKRDVGHWLDEIIEHAVPDVRKAVRWNSPFYGVEGQGWFLSFHVFARYVKVTFFAGKSLRPIPPGGTPRSGEARWIDIHEKDERDAVQIEAWIRQAAALPGWLA